MQSQSDNSANKNMSRVARPQLRPNICLGSEAYTRVNMMNGWIAVANVLFSYRFHHEDIL